MTENEKEFINLIRNSEQPEKTAEYMLSLLLDYLQTHKTSANEQSPYLEEIAELLPQLSSNKQSKALNYLIELKGE